MRVLVAYASKHGSTQGIAEAIGDRLRERGVEVELQPLREVDRLERYDAVVVGSAVYIGSWMKEAQRFLDRHAEDLRRVPVWLFSSGPTGTDANAEALLDKQKRRLDGVGARDHHVASFLWAGAVPGPSSGLGSLAGQVGRGVQDREMPGGTFLTSSSGPLHAAFEEHRLRLRHLHTSQRLAVRRHDGARLHGYMDFSCPTAPASSVKAGSGDMRRFVSLSDFPLAR